MKELPLSPLFDLRYLRDKFREWNNLILLFFFNISLNKLQAILRQLSEIAQGMPMDVLLFH